MCWFNIFYHGRCTLLVSHPPSLLHHANFSDIYIIGKEGPPVTSCRRAQHLGGICKLKFLPELCAHFKGWYPLRLFVVTHFLALKNCWDSHIMCIIPQDSCLWQIVTSEESDMNRRLSWLLDCVVSCSIYHPLYPCSLLLHTTTAQALITEVPPCWIGGRPIPY